MRMPENGGSGLESFSHLGFLILVPVFTTLKLQTAEQVAGCNIATFKPEWEEHVLMYDMSSKGKFDKFKNQVLNPQNKGHLFVIIADESHWGYNRGGAHDTFVNDSDLLEAKNLIIVQVSATPYCNLTRHSRVPEKYIEDVAAEGELKILDPEKARSSENYSQFEELHVVKWYPPKQEADKSRYLRLEHFLRTIPSEERHHARAQDLNGAVVVKRPLSLQYIRQDDWLVNLFEVAKVKGKAGNHGRGGAGKKRKLEDEPDLQPEHMWLADMILSLVYFRTYRWDVDNFELCTLHESQL
jgi:hypothetical protein